MKKQAAEVAAKGRYGDTMLVHMNPVEVKYLHENAPGGLTVNPDTGQPEAFLPLALSLLGGWGAGALGLGATTGALSALGTTGAAALGSGLGAATGSVAQGDDFKDAMLSGLLAGGTAGVMGSFGDAAIEGAAGTARHTAEGMPMSDKFLADEALYRSRGLADATEAALANQPMQTPLDMASSVPLAERGINPDSLTPGATAPRAPLGRVPLNDEQLANLAAQYQTPLEAGGVTTGSSPKFDAAYEGTAGPYDKMMQGFGEGSPKLMETIGKMDPATALPAAGAMVAGTAGGGLGPLMGPPVPPPPEGLPRKSYPKLSGGANEPEKVYTPKPPGWTNAMGEWDYFQSPQGFAEGGPIYTPRPLNFDEDEAGEWNWNFQTPAPVPSKSVIPALAQVVAGGAGYGGGGPARRPPPATGYGMAPTPARRPPPATGYGMAQGGMVRGYAKGGFTDLDAAKSFSDAYNSPLGITAGLGVGFAVPGVGVIGQAANYSANDLAEKTTGIKDQGGIFDKGGILGGMGPVSRAASKAFGSHDSFKIMDKVGLTAKDFGTHGLDSDAYAERRGIEKRAEHPYADNMGAYDEQEVDDDSLDERGIGVTPADLAAAEAIAVGLGKGLLPGVAPPVAAPPVAAPPTGGPGSGGIGGGSSVGPGGGFADDYGLSQNPEDIETGAGEALYAHGGLIKGYAEGGLVPDPRANPQQQQPNPIVVNAVAAIKGQHPEPQKAIQTFVQVYGPEKFAALRQQVIAEASQGQRQASGLGLVRGAGDGLSDSVPANIQGQEPVALSDGEVVVPADVVAHLGNGSSDAGAKALEDMNKRVRGQRTGQKNQPGPIDPRQVMPV